VEAMAAVIRGCPRAVLVAVGDPWEGQPVRILRQARQLGIGDAVICPGRRDDVRRFIRAATVCVSSSIASEENSRAVSEYMACAKPVVVTEIGVMPELVDDGISGRVVSSRNPAVLGAAIGEILGNPELARRMGAAGRRAAEERFSASVFREKLRRVLDRTIAEFGTGRSPTVYPPLNI
jgi:glycosyltransferase involved in cell wall biosynthesis